jgi:C4-dicarboxylate-binding protein DctP
MRKNIFIIIAVLAFIIISIQEVAAKKIVIKFSHVTGPKSSKGILVEKFKELAEKYTDGAVEVQHFHSYQLYPDDTKAVQAVRSGALEMVCPVTATFTGMFPEVQLFDLPYTFLNWNMAREAFESPEIGKKIFNMMKTKGLFGLGVWGQGFREVGNRLRPIKSLEDYKGIKIRVMPSKIMIEMFKHVGANPVVMSGGEVPTALQQGTIDAIDYPFNTWESQKVYEMVKYITETKHAFSGYIWATSSKFWEGLPKNVRIQLQKAVDEVNLLGWDFCEEWDLKALQKIKATGLVELYHPTKQQYLEWADEFKPVSMRFSDVIGKDLLDALYRLQAKYK